MTDYGSGYNKSMPPLVAHADFFSIKLVFGLFWLQGDTSFIIGSTIILYIWFYPDLILWDIIFLMIVYLLTCKMGH